MVTTSGMSELSISTILRTQFNQTELDMMRDQIAGTRS